MRAPRAAAAGSTSWPERLSTKAATSSSWRSLSTSPKAGMKPWRPSRMEVSMSSTVPPHSQASSARFGNSPMRPLPSLPWQGAQLSP